MLQWLADDEAEHEKWFTKLKQNVNEKIEDPKFEEMGREILGGVLGEHAFSMEEADFSSLKDIKDVLELSLEFEKDTLVFYEMLEEFVEDEKVLSGIAKIIKEENRHIAYLQEFLEKGEIPSLKHT
jgi:rubrerythrin